MKALIYALKSVLFQRTILEKIDASELPWTLRNYPFKNTMQLVIFLKRGKWFTQVISGIAINHCNIPFLTFSTHRPVHWALVSSLPPLDKIGKARLDKAAYLYSLYHYHYHSYFKAVQCALHKKIFNNNKRKKMIIIGKQQKILRIRFINAKATKKRTQ